MNYGIELEYGVWYVCMHAYVIHVWKVCMCCLLLQNYWHKWLIGSPIKDPPALFRICSLVVTFTANREYVLLSVICCNHISSCGFAFEIHRAFEVQMGKGSLVLLLLLKEHRV